MEAPAAVPAPVPDNNNSKPPKNDQKGNPKANQKGSNKKEKPAKSAPVELPNVEFIETRMKKYEELKKKYEEELTSKPDEPIKITLPDGAVKDGVKDKTRPLDVALMISKGLADSVVVAKVDGVLTDLQQPLDKDCKLELFKFDTPEGKDVFWHSSAHIMGAALERFYGAKLCTGPPVEDGFFYDSRIADGQRSISPEEFEHIEKIINQIINEKQVFEKLWIRKEDALEMFKYNPYKYEILKEKVPDGTKCSVYRTGTLVDPCRGPHIPNTNRIKGFKLIKNSSSYWKGKAENDQLQRLYGIAFPDKKMLTEWIKFQEEAALRDHRNIGKAQELFFFHPLSPGCAFFLPHGARIYNKLQELIRFEYRKRGFTEVVTPNLFNCELWEKSGHWAHYKENMFQVSIENQTHALKPMNCPSHCLMFAHRTRSYRELPIRLADFGVLHRNEASGALTGLTRVRRFQQDDAHIFCTIDQIAQEMRGAFDFLSHIYGIFGFNFKLELSTRPENFLGEIETWNTAEAQLKEILDQFCEASGRSWKLNPGDGAFYGPKIDIHIEDAIKRSHQCATIQLDFQLPIKFNLEYTGAAENETVRPVIIHRAIYGSLERMIAILTEHVAGKWPFWISPRQAVVIPISAAQNDYAQKVQNRLWSEGFFVDVDVSDKSFEKKVREGQLAQYNYILVAGGREVEGNQVNVRNARTNAVEGTKLVDEVVAYFKQMAAEYK